MTFINKDKVLNGVGKAVDVTNNVADKTQEYIKKMSLIKKQKIWLMGLARVSNPLEKK